MINRKLIATIFVGLATPTLAHAQTWGDIATSATLTNGRACFTDGTDIICDNTAPTIAGTNAALEIPGSIQIGNGAESCDAAHAGLMRYNSNNVEFCNGTAWGVLTSAASAVSEINDLSDAITSATSVFLGAGAGAVNDGTANENTSVGINALAAVVSGSKNTAVGKDALSTLTASGNNTAMGYASLQHNNSGGQNVAIGNDALKGTSSYTGSDQNVAIGRDAGKSIGNNMDSNVFIGFSSAGTQTAGSNNIAIGSNVDLPSLTGSNQLNIGNTLYGDLTNDRIGVGVLAPAVALDVNGSVLLGDGGETCDATTEGAIRYNGGNVQYCNATAWADLTSSTFAVSVLGDLTNVNAGAPTDNQVLTWNNGAGEWQAQSAAATDAIIDADSDTQIQVEESADDDTIRFDTAGVERVVIGATGQVDINGLIKFNNAAGSTGVGGASTTPALDGLTDVNAGSPADGQALVWNNGAGEWQAQSAAATDGIIDADSNTQIQVEESADDNTIRFDTAGVERLVIGSDGLIDANAFLKFNDTTGSTGVGGSSSTPALDGLTDVNAGSPTDNQVLTWDNGSGEWQAKSAAATDGIIDADSNTQIQVEESADDNTIRFDTAGVERVVISSTGQMDINGLVKFNDTTGSAGVGGSSSTPALDGLTDVNAGSPTDGQALVWNNGAGEWQAQSAAATDGIIDADSNTQIQVEESADDNTIRFDTAGVERLIIDETGLIDASGLVKFSDTTGSAGVGGSSATPALDGLTDVNAGSPTDNQVLTWDNGSGEWQAKSAAATDGVVDADSDTQIQVEEGADDDTIRFDTAGVERVVIGATGQVDINGIVKFNNTTGAAGVGGSSGTPALDGLTDVNAGSPTDGQALVWNNGASEWQAQSAAATDGIIDADSNTQIQVEESADDNTIRFDTDGVERLVIGSDGLIDANALVKLNDTAGGTGLGGSSGTPALDGLTDVNAGSPTDGQALVWNNGAGEWQAQSAAATDGIIDADSNTQIQVEESADDNTIRFDTAGVERLVIGATGTITAEALIELNDTTGSVGVGGSSATPALSGLTDVNVGSPTDGQVLTWDDDPGEWVAQPASATDGIIDADNNTQIQVEESADDNTIRFDTAGVERLIIDATGLIDASGLVKFNDTTGGTGLGGDVAAAASDGLNDADDNTKIYVEKNTDENIIRMDTAGSERLTILADGKVGIATVAPTSALEVNGEMRATNYVTTSDRNFKENIETMENSLGKIIKLRGVTYDFKNLENKKFPEGKQVGLIAQEVEEVFPELVSGTEGNKAVNYAAMVAPLIEAVKAQQKLLNKQNDIIDALSKRLTTLEKK